MTQDGIIFNIQKFSLHDGPGIRTVVFLKGCPLRCKWCANPEGITAEPQIMRDLTRCVKCGLCADKPHEDVSLCSAGALSIAGERMDVETIVNKAMQDEAFYRQSGGGVTISGGEPLSQIDFVEALCKALKEKGVSVAVETSGYAQPETFSRLINAVDIILYDIKHYDAIKHQKYTGVHNECILANLRVAVDSGKPVTARIPVIPGVNASLDDMRVFGELLSGIGVKKVSLLPFHQLGENKYHLLNKTYGCKYAQPLHKEDLIPHKKVLNSFGIKATIGG